MNTTRYRIFEVKYVPETHTRQSRIRIRDLRGFLGERNKKPTIHILFDSVARGCDEQASAHLASIGIKITGEAHTIGTTYLLSEDFKTPLIKG